MNRAEERLDWTPEQIDKLKALFELGHTYEEIGEKFGVSRNAIAGKVARMRLTRVKPAKQPATRPEPFWTPERVETLVAMFAAGESNGAIGKALGCSRNTAGGKCIRLGLKRSATITQINNKRGALLRAPAVSRAPSTGNGANFGKTRAGDPGLAPKRTSAWDPLPGSTPRAWTERRFTECSWPVGDGLSCCEPVHRFGWCGVHAARGRVAPNRRAA